MIELVNFIMWCAIVLAMLSIAGVAGTKIEREWEAEPPTRLRKAAASGVALVIFAAGVLHPAVVTYPTLPGLQKSVAAEVRPDGSLHRLPYGAIDFLVEGPIVRLGQPIECPLENHFEIKGTGIYGRMFDNFPTYVTFDMDDEQFYRKMEGVGKNQRTFFCGSVLGSVRQAIGQRIAGRELDFNPEGRSYPADAAAIKSALEQRILQDHPGYGIRKVRVHMF